VNVIYHKSKLTEILGKDIVEFYQATYSEEELEILHAELDQIALSKSINGVTIETIVTNVVDETVEVYIKPYNSDSIALLRKHFVNQPITIKESKGNANSSRLVSYDPLQGGTQIENVTKGWTCTLGFNARLGTGSGGTKFVVTAGHCGSVGNIFEQGGQAIGMMTKKNEEYRSDAALIGTTTDVDYGPNYYTSTSYGGTFTSWQLYTDDVVGESVCMSGKVSGVKCGELKSRSVSGYWSNEGEPPKYFQSLRGADYTTVKGDSGAPVYC
jgi:hypothetical protein